MNYSLILRQVNDKMLDSDGYRFNVGIVIINDKNQVFWAKRTKKNAWQFPQGGIKKGEKAEQAMYRELKEETGITRNYVRVLGRTEDWLYYDVPNSFIKLENRKVYKGQKQIWFLLKFEGKFENIDIPEENGAEFDSWMWIDYADPPKLVVDFKKKVYTSALLELAPFVFSSSALDKVKFKLSL